MQSITNNNFDKHFALRPLKAAKVSEISEATAASTTPPSDRVNFHIGNPVQDDRLLFLYLQYILGFKNEFNLTDYNPTALCNRLNWRDKDKKKLDLLFNSVKNSGPYMPRGGFNRTDPNYLIKHFHSWLTEKQQEPLHYDLGEKSGKRECIIASGGRWEALRIFLHSLNEYLLADRVDIFQFALEIPEHLLQYNSLNFNDIGSDQNVIIDLIANHFAADNSNPAFLLIGEKISEQVRRSLRLLALNHPLFFVELNDAPNNISIAREAGMQNKVLRFITPSVFSEQFRKLPVIFVAGNTEFIKVIETIHFQLKGTPSASEVELLSYLLINYSDTVESKNNFVESESQFEELENFEYSQGASLIKKVTGILESKSVLFDKKINNLSDYVINLELRTQKLNNRFIPVTDTLQSKTALECLDELICKLDDNEYHNQLSESFLNVFAETFKHYNPAQLTLISGSSRTALSILGFHCGIDELITCDLSWTYEDCFPSVKAFPLTSDYNLDIKKIKKFINDNRKSVTKKTAFVFNNPHNATGKVFNSRVIKELMTFLIQNDIYIIDDLAYQNVMPFDSIDGPKTIKQLSIDLVNEGKLFSDQLSKVISVHSISKTDCFAGARLAVAEIIDYELSEKFKTAVELIKPNLMAVLLSYLFYRNRQGLKNNYWLLRNKILGEKLLAIKKALKELPADRNPFDINIIEPEGSMYPQLVINKLPDGLSLDWLSSGLATQGIGLVPLSTFARTSEGFDLGRMAFRLTLGGTDNPDTIYTKTRRVIIDLNRIIGEEKTKYNRISLIKSNTFSHSFSQVNKAAKYWEALENKLKIESNNNLHKRIKELSFPNSNSRIFEHFNDVYLAERLSSLKNIFLDRIELLNNTAAFVAEQGAGYLTEHLYKELYKDNIEDRQIRFRNRTFDRTVHPTQNYSLDIDKHLRIHTENILHGKSFTNFEIKNFSGSLVKEFLGQSVAINSIQESDELIYDLHSLLDSELYAQIYSTESFETFLSFWGDWDGSNRPSGQGHRLIAAALLENVTQLADLITLLLNADRSISIDARQLREIKLLPEHNKEFWNLLHEITALTNHLEKRYRSVLPFSVSSGKIRSIGMKLGLAADPLTKLWQHNDGLEQRMINLRRKRRDKLEYYFSLNKNLRKTLYDLVPKIGKNISNFDLIIKAASYKNILNRFILTPRIHQKLINAKDQFSINTTVHNIMELNELSGKYGNPGMVLALQVSMSTDAESLISLERKFSSEKERILNSGSSAALPNIWCIPLFEDVDTVLNVENYLNRIWKFSVQSRGIDQDTKERFSQIMCEVFIAGSDLSQQIGQTASWAQYNTAKYKTIKWLAEKGLGEEIRMKLGSGEPMQRQGGYYAEFSGKPAFIKAQNNADRFSKYLRESTIKSTEFAKTPLHGVMSRVDLLTFQSNISEKLRSMPIEERTQLLYHVNRSQKNHRMELARTSEPFTETRLKSESRNLQELKRITMGNHDEIFERFVELTKNNFQNILYGTENDVVGIHLISYFVSRSTPVLRDRPNERPSRSMGGDKGQKILERIASTIPLSKHGSLLRAIGHNRAQSMILGINQLTTGLFRSLKEFSQMDFVQGTGMDLLTDRILPHLPVYEILSSLRIYHDRELLYLNKLSNSYPPGFGPFALLREDIDSYESFIPLIQKELLRRHGINVNDFFEEGKFIIDLLPTLRPDLSVLLQPDLFNMNLENIIKKIDGITDPKWLEQFSELLLVPKQIMDWRAKVWELLERPVTEQVKSFVDLAIALNTLSKEVGNYEFPLAGAKIKKARFETSLTDLLKGKVDDSMRQFLSAAVQYLTRLPDEIVEVPIDIVRALKEVERILRIEEQALDKRGQKLLNFYILQMARIVGENG
ncbi:MAG: aminotransferase class I/II-fold pyridoxal phosphate-dependent enzyme [Bacteroidetes bacterium]|nr:aminotransferase class I/II-fold pyridoxal phosphate-dependent enzyme [Bacteroidota bacterium]